MRLSPKTINHTIDLLSAILGRRQQRAKVGAAFNELMYGAGELASRTDDEVRSSGGDLLMRSPFDEAVDPSRA